MLLAAAPHVHLQCRKTPHTLVSAIYRACVLFERAVSVSLVERADEVLLAAAPHAHLRHKECVHMQFWHKLMRFF